MPDRHVGNATEYQAVAHDPAVPAAPWQASVQTTWRTDQPPATTIRAQARASTSHFTEIAPPGELSQPVSLRLTRAVLSEMTGRPPPSMTGMTASSTVSTRPADAKLPNRAPPPNSQMSLPS